MCTISMIMDHYTERWSDRVVETPLRPLTPSEIDDMQALLERAKKYDKANNEPDCELESKKQLLLDLAAQLGATVIFPAEVTQRAEG